MIYLKKVFLIYAAATCLSGCTNEEETTNLKSYPINSTEGIIDVKDAKLDNEVTSDGNGALYFTAKKPKTIKLYETDDIDIENAKITYEAKVKTKGVKGKVYIEMLCTFSDQGEFFSRSLHSTLSGDQEWTLLKTPFFLQKGQNPNNIKLNLVIEGTGEVWIDEILLNSGKLK